MMSYKLVVKRKDGKPTRAEIQTNFKCWPKILKHPKVQSKRLRGTSVLTSVECDDERKLCVKIGPGFFAGREPSEQQIRARASKALMELADSIDFKALSLSMTLEWLSKQEHSVVEDALSGKHQVTEKELHRVVKRITQSTANIINLANYLKLEQK